GVGGGNGVRRGGMQVGVYEQAPALSEVGAGVAPQPNGIRMLQRLGLGEEVSRCGARWVDPQFRRADGSFAASLWPSELSSKIEFYGMHRAGLLGMLVHPVPGDVVQTKHRRGALPHDDTPTT